MITVLNESRANALVCIITIGFIRQQLAKKDDYRRTMFQCDDEHTRTLVLNFFRNLGIQLEFTPALPDYEFPLILSKPAQARDPYLTAVQTYPQVQTMFDALEAYGIALERDSPVGAYIGGTVTTNGGGYTYTLVGPTNLVVYNPCFGAQRRDIKRSFDNAKIETAKALSIIQVVRDDRRNLLPPDPVVYDISNVLLNTEDLQSGVNLFGSVHGMVVSMLKHPDLQGNSFHFELAMGPNTSKVASCIPCSMFMESMDRPAHSTHFGRGDCWNFPTSGKEFSKLDEQRKKWENKIIEWYNVGLATLNERANQVFAVQPLSEFRTPITREENIPQMFLEALTFQGKFTDKFISTFGLR